MFAICGCGGGDDVPRVATQPTKGTLTLNGQPYGPASVQLIPAVLTEETRTVTGTVDAGGNITFTSYEVGDGAPAGSYKVIVLPGMQGAPAEGVPSVYQSENTTTLTATIAEATDDAPNQVAVEMQGTGSARPGTHTTMEGIDPSIAFPGGTGNE
jgi:hypothetical protein